jgi:hypothetical protein
MRVRMRRLLRLGELTILSMIIAIIWVGLGRLRFRIIVMRSCGRL